MSGDLGAREADCGCCTIVDTVSLDALATRLAAAGVVVERLERRVADSGFDPLDALRSDRGPGDHERQGYLDGLRTAARLVGSALDGPQDAATGEVALGSTDEQRGPQIAECGRRHPGTCAWIGKGSSLPPICLQPESPASGAESDRGGRGDGEGLG